jgi:hypothetical protein
MMRVKLFHRSEILNGMTLVFLTQVEVISPDNTHLAFARISPELLEFIRSLELDVPDNLLTWKGKFPCSANTFTRS